MDKQRMQELIENFIDYLIDCNGDIDDVLLILELNIGMKKQNGKNLVWLYPLTLTMTMNKAKHKEKEK